MNAKTAVMRRGFSEIRRLCSSYFPVLATTFDEASGFGDLVLSCSVGRGQRLAKALVRAVQGCGTVSHVREALSVSLSSRAGVPILSEGSSRARVYPLESLEVSPRSRGDHLSSRPLERWTSLLETPHRSTTQRWKVTPSGSPPTCPTPGGGKGDGFSPFSREAPVISLESPGV